MSRSSSGFESSHLPSPEYPAIPRNLTSTSPSETFLQSKPGCLPPVLPSPNPTKNSLSLQIPVKGHLPQGYIARSQSYSEVRGNPPPGQLRRCSSLTGLLTQQGAQKGKLLDPTDWNPAHSTKTEASTQHAINSQKQVNIAFPPTQTSLSYDAVSSSLNMDDMLTSGQTETVSCTHLQLPSTVSAQHPNHPLPREMTHTDHISSAHNGARSISASSEARRLKLRRNKKISVDTVRLGSWLEERLQSNDVTMEPFSDKVLASKMW